jgi:hypothetical protein
MSVKEAGYRKKLNALKQIKVEMSIFRYSVISNAYGGTMGISSQEIRLRALKAFED